MNDATTQEPWDHRASHALVEAQVMCESIRTIAQHLIDTEADAGEAFPFLEAIVACTLRSDGAGVPVIEERLRERSHDTTQPARPQ